MDSLIGAATQALAGQGQGHGGSGPDWVGIVSGLLANGSAQGGLGGLLKQLEGAGLGEQVQSWVGHGANQPVSGDQLSAALGGDLMSQLAGQAGVSHAEAGSQLSQMLPEIINMLTPHGEVPAAGAGGLGDMGELASLLGGLLKKA
ncbi:YidB family protein [Paucibacter sp. B2R-40]|uniref:YidB family protein n=1 Tax=Paucibacter sp. B2R-40 TaxID=2893554 RepID=UPI0021E407E5|nr:YidB family protein [Paucibacter sp. B2R-40]